MKAFVYGATGKVSGRVMENLTGKGVEVVAGTRDPAKAPEKKGVTWVKAVEEKGTENLDGVDRAFFLAPPGYPDQDRILIPWIEAAKKHHVKKVVLMTAMGVEQAPPETPFRRVELALMESGLNYEIVRPNWFFDNFHTFWISGILSDGKIYFPGGDAKVSFIDARDIGDVAAALLLSDHTSGEHNITGPESIDHSEVARTLSAVFGKQIEYVDITPEQFKSGLIDAGISEQYAGFLVYIAGALKAGYSAAVTDEVEKILGRKPIDLAAYAKDYAASWK